MSSLAAPSRRPTVTRRDTEVILSYYQSDLPGKDYLSDDLDDPVRRFEASRSRRRTNSNASSSSLYSTPNTPPTTHDLPPPLLDSTVASSSAPQSHRRRPSNQSTSDPDRRMAIVQSDTARFLPLSLDTVAGSSAHPPPSSKQTTASSSSTTTATKPTKPSSSQDPSHPRSHQPTSAPPKPRDADASQPLSHQRSMSDAVHANGAGTLRQRASNKNVHAHLTALSDGPGSSSSRSSSRPRTPEDATTADPPHAPSNAHSSGAPASNSGHRHRPYEPGLHSTAGPLPPPPRATIAVDATSPPPPRPPRLRSPSPVVRSSSDIGTPTIASVISPKASSSSLNLLNPDLVEKPLATVAEGSVAQFSAAQHHSERSSHHVREGAFQPSRILAGPSSRPSPNPQDTIRLVGPNGAATSTLSDGLPASTTMHPFVDGLPASDSSPLTTPHLSSRPDVRRDPSWVSVHVPSDPPSEYPSPEPGPIPTTESPTAISFSPEPFGSTSAPADQLPTGTDGLRSKKERGSPRVPTVVVGLLSDDKRNSSLPRTPSFVSTSTTQTRSPSPPPAPTPLQPPQPPRPPKPKIVSLWPEPMWCRDVLALRTPLERSQAYARKINDLAQYDSGLSAWVATTRAGARSAGSGRSLPKATSRAVSIKPIPRQVSRSSISSEATFPLRPDAYVATDLTTRTSDDLAPTTAPPPALPYPALANASSLTLASTSASTASSSNRLSFVPSHSQHQQQSASRALLERANVGGGFFSSIGRNYSMNARKDSSARSPVQHAPNRLIKAPPAGSGSPSTSTSSPTPASTSTTPRPALTSTPTVPGGPRAPPGRVARSQTLMLPPSPSQGSSSDGGGSSPSPSPSQSVSLGPQPRRRSNTLKRPSLFGSGGPRGMPTSGSGGGGGGGSGSSPGVGPSSFQSFSQQGQDAKELAVDFQRQVDKLAELVPHADRDVLAGYLRRAGQDMLAIGQYLEDERSGSLRRD